jgi:hypothetical protein
MFKHTASPGSPRKLSLAPKYGQKSPRPVEASPAEAAVADERGEMLFDKVDDALFLDVLVHCVSKVYSPNKEMATVSTGLIRIVAREANIYSCCSDD